MRFLMKLGCDRRKSQVFDHSGGASCGSKATRCSFNWPADEAFGRPPQALGTVCMGRGKTLRAAAFISGSKWRMSSRRQAANGNQ